MTPTPHQSPTPDRPTVVTPGLPAPTRLVEHAGLWAAHRPWLALVALGLIILWVAAAQWWGRLRHTQHTNGARLVTVAPPPEVDPAGAGALWANLAGTLNPRPWRRLRYGRPHLVWQYTWAGRQLTITVWVPGTVPVGAVEAAIRGAWPAATLATTPATPPIPAGVTHATGGHLRPVHPDTLPLDTDPGTDPLRALTAAGTGLRPGEYAVVQILARPTRPRRARRARRAAARMRRTTTAPGWWGPGAVWSGTAGRGRVVASRWRDPGVERDVRAMMDKTTHPLWDTAVCYTVAARARGNDPTPRLRAVAARVSAAFAVYTARNQLTHHTRMRQPVATVASCRLGRGFLTSTPELALLAGLPQDLAVPGLDRAHAKPVAPPVLVPTGGRNTKVLGDADPGGHAVALPVADARYHLHILGATGSGKTTLLAELVCQDILGGRGTVVIDPHGDLVLDILDRLPATVADRVVLFDPDQPNPPVLNPLDGDDHNLLVDNIVAIMSSIFVKAWGPRMDDVMRVACLTLLRHANATLQHIPPLLNSAQVRAELTADLDDPEGLSGFWQWYDQMNPALRAQVIGPVLARLRSFLLRDFAKRSMGQPHSTVDMTQVLDGGVLLARLPKGTLGEETSRLMGSFILAKVWQTATARASLPAHQRRDCTVYLDEAVCHEAL